MEYSPSTEANDNESVLEISDGPISEVPQMDWKGGIELPSWVAAAESTDRPSEVWILEVTDGGNPAGRVQLERYTTVLGSGAEVFSNQCHVLVRHLTNGSVEGIDTCHAAIALNPKSCAPLGSTNAKPRSGRTKLDFSVIDLNSLKSTKLNGSVIQSGVCVSLKAGDKFSLGESSKVFRLVRGMAAPSEKKSFAASVQRAEDVLDMPSLSPVPQHFSADGLSAVSAGPDDLGLNGQGNFSPALFDNNDIGSQDAHMHSESSRDGEPAMGTHQYITDEFHGSKIVDYDVNHSSSDSRSDGGAYSSSVNVSVSDSQRGGPGNSNGESYHGKGKHATADSNANSNANSSGHAHTATQPNSSSSSGNYSVPHSNTSKSRASNSNSHGVGPYGPGPSVVTANGSYLKNDKGVEVGGAKEIILKENTYIDKYGNVKFICRDAIESHDRHGSARAREKDKDKDKDRDRNNVRDQGTPSKSIEKKSDGKGAVGAENGRKPYRDGERRNRSRSRSRSVGRTDSRERDSNSNKDNRYRRKGGRGSASRSMDRSRDRNAGKSGKVTSNSNRQGGSASGAGGNSRGRSSSRSRNKRNTGSRNSINNGNSNGSRSNQRKRSFSSSRSRSFSRSRSPGGRKGWTNGASVGRRGNRDSRSHSRSRTYSRSPHKDRDRDRRRRTPSRSRSRSISKSRGRSGDRDRDRDWKDKGRSKGGGGGGVSKNNARRSRSRSRTGSRRRDRDRVSRSREGDKDKDKGNASKYQRKNNNDRMAVYGSADSSEISKYQAQPNSEVRVNKYQAPAQESEAEALKRIENRKILLESEWQRELVRREREAVVELQRKEREKERDKSSAAFQRYSSSAMVVQSEEGEAGQDVEADAGECEESADIGANDTYEKYESYGGEAQALSSSGTDCDREGEEFIQEQENKLSVELDDMALTSKAAMGANGSSDRDRDIGWMKVSSINSKSAASDEEEAEDGQCEGDVSGLGLGLGRRDDAGPPSTDIAATEESGDHILRGISTTESSSSRQSEEEVSCSRDEGIGAGDASADMRPEQAGGNDETLAAPTAGDFDYNDINRLLSSGGECSRLGSLIDLDLDQFQSTDAENGDFLFELDSDMNSGNIMRDVES